MVKTGNATKDGEDSAGFNSFGSCAVRACRAPGEEPFASFAASSCTGSDTGRDAARGDLCNGGSDGGTLIGDAGVAVSAIQTEPTEKHGPVRYQRVRLSKPAAMFPV